MVKCTTRQQQRRSFIDNIPGQLGNQYQNDQPGLTAARNNWSDGGTNGNSTTYKASVKSPPPACQHLVFYPSRIPILQPNQQSQSTEGKQHVREI